MEAYTGGISTRKVDALVEALGGASGISKSEVSRICQCLDEQVKAFLQRPLDHARFPYVYLDATYLHGRLGPNLQVVSRAVVVAIGINALGYREVLGIAVGDSEAEGFWRQFLGSLKERGLAGTRLVISDAYLGLTAGIRRMLQGCSWQRRTERCAGWIFLGALPAQPPEPCPEIQPGHGGVRHARPIDTGYLWAVLLLSNVRSSE
jgi:putative transposase